MWCSHERAHPPTPPTSSFECLSRHVTVIGRDDMTGDYRHGGFVAVISLTADAEEADWVSVQTAPGILSFACASLYPGVTITLPNPPPDHRTTIN
ncbi:unnamed protein product [Arctogadus glacialis]